MSDARYNILRRRGHDYAIVRQGDGKVMAYARNRKLAKQLLRMIEDATRDDDGK